ncbi:hypothetical protein CCH79_00008674 [Gambusia affinis]|uniref:Uncharacterized protein n=1 Tax=Gambusia affinis TaxID=33528 RepID=A0A315UUP1_GAMAF|nr:hypothetical protein CCH79_00008674 [Gambusia affinis]
MSRKKQPKDRVVQEVEELPKIQKVSNLLSHYQCRPLVSHDVIILKVVQSLTNNYPILQMIITAQEMWRLTSLCFVLF